MVVIASTAWGSELQLMECRHNYRKRLVSLDSRLSLSFERLYDFTVKIKTLSTAKTSLEVVVPGRRFRVRGLFAAERASTLAEAGDFEDSERLASLRFLSAFERDVTVNSKGELAFSAVLASDFSETPWLETRQRFFLEVVALSATGDLEEAVTSVAAFHPLEETALADFVPYPASLAAVQAQLVPAEVPLQHWSRGALKLAKIDLHRGQSAKENLEAAIGTKPTVIDLSDIAALAPHADLQNLGWHVPLLSDLLQRRAKLAPAEVKQFLESLCVLEGSPRPPRVKKGHATGVTRYEDCVGDPKRFFQLQHLEFVDAVTSSEGNPLQLRSRRHPIEVHACFRYYRRQTNDRRKGVEHADALRTESLLRAGVEFFGLGGGVQTGWLRETEWFGIDEISQAEELQNHISLSERRDLTADELEVTFDATVKACLLLRSVPVRAKSRLNYLLCRSELQHRSESWFYVAEDKKHGSAQADPLDLGSREWLALVRGKAEFAKLKQGLGDRTRAVRLRAVDSGGIPVDPLLEEYRTRRASSTGDFQDRGAFPGLLSLTTL